MYSKQVKSVSRLLVLVGRVGTSPLEYSFSGGMTQEDELDEKELLQLENEELDEQLDEKLDELQLELELKLEEQELKSDNVEISAMVADRGQPQQVNQEQSEVLNEGQR